MKSKWIFTVKKDANGEVERLKARLVAKGFTQVKDVDYSETFSPVFAHSSLRMMLALAAKHDLKITSWDLTSAFVQTKLDREHIFMQTPFGFPTELPDGRRTALRLKQSLYGLKQSSKILHESVKEFVKSLGYEQSISDSCLFIKRPNRSTGTTPNGKSETGIPSGTSYILTYVDDIVMFSPKHDAELRKTFDKAIRAKYLVGKFTKGIEGDCDWLLKMNIKRNWEKGTLHLSQSQAIEKLYERFITQKSTSFPRTPMATGLSLTKTDPRDIIPRHQFDYMSCVGSLLYISLTTRPDICQAVGVLSRYMSCPGREHIEAAKRVVLYLKGTQNHGILFDKAKTLAPNIYYHCAKGKSALEGTDDNQLLRAFTDSDFAADVNTRRSTTGFVILVAGGAISWRSKLQSTVALSTMEAETIAGVEATKELLHLRLLLKEIGLPEAGASKLYEDNASAIHVGHGSEGNKKTKHFQIKVKWLIEQYKEGQFKYVKIATKDNLADHFTKPLALCDHEKFRKWMGVHSINKITQCNNDIDDEPTDVGAFTSTVGAMYRLVGESSKERKRAIRNKVTDVPRSYQCGFGYRTHPGQMLTPVTSTRWEYQNRELLKEKIVKRKSLYLS